MWNIPIMCCSSLMYYDSLHTPLWPLVITWIRLPTYRVNTSLQLNALERNVNALWGIILAYNSNKVIVSFWTFSAEWCIYKSTLDWLSVLSVWWGWDGESHPYQTVFLRIQTWHLDIWWLSLFFILHKRYFGWTFSVSIALHCQKLCLHFLHP